MVRPSNDSEIKKGPWTAEEDEVLLDFVRKNGPRDWSSIRSKGLLPRTGKSCRLRWVNKLRPNLKVGCKFTSEEEKLVVELQGRVGNKWATIASYLQGRTDNDVKNFWSTRQKRLARLLQRSSSSSSSSTSSRSSSSTSSNTLPFCSREQQQKQGNVNCYKEGLLSSRKRKKEKSAAVAADVESTYDYPQHFQVKHCSNPIQVGSVLPPEPSSCFQLPIQPPPTIWNTEMLYAATPNFPYPESVMNPSYLTTYSDGLSDSSLFQNNQPPPPPYYVTSTTHDDLMFSQPPPTKLGLPFDPLPPPLNPPPLDQFHQPHRHFHHDSLIPPIDFTHHDPIMMMSSSSCLELFPPPDNHRLQGEVGVDHLLPPPQSVISNTTYEQFPAFGLPFLEIRDEGRVMMDDDRLGAPDSFFGDFPVDEFDRCF